ncbi:MULTISPECIES: linear amide C-N hydrolase [unclassified Xanthobacter]|uniref:linear amide C-N hydrolase n=1 Tax=unclassified Xanthobacter TaxID=2623496 RepID=UPI001EE02417|nr:MULTISPECIES: choloylglycine hydrolase family protein [unclassified Xanthobacter]
MRIYARTATALLAGAALLTQSLGASACTSLILKAKDGGVVYGRTMEFGLPLQSEALVMPRNIALTGTGPTGEAGTGLSWTGKYAAVGLNGIGLKVFIDGMNEKGLAGGLLYLPNLAQFQDVSPAEAKNSIASYEMLTYVLTSFATVAEVKAAMPKIKVSAAPQAVFKGPVPVHMTLHDASGASLVVEYVGGTLHMYDNPTSVLTNAPTFDWHLANLGQYVNLSAVEPDPIKVGPLTIAAPSTGAGLHGLPGDMLSPSRFLRAFFFSHNAPEAATTAEALVNVRHIMSSFDIAPGSVVTKAGSTAGGGVAGFETTEWTVYADLKNLRYTFTTYDNPSLQGLDFAKLKLDGKAPQLLPLPAAPAPIAIGQ